MLEFGSHTIRSNAQNIYKTFLNIYLKGEFYEKDNYISDDSFNYFQY